MGRVLPILFNGDMVRAILEDRKTVTRRIVKQSVWESFVCEGGKAVNWLNPKTDALESPVYRAPYQPGDIMYVRETWAEWTDGYVYRTWIAPFPQAGCYPTTVWHPSIHMPKEAARIWLKVTDVRAERLKDIDALGCQREGVDITRNGVFKRFSSLWESSIRKEEIDRYGWDANPWVWVIEFERCGKPEREG